MHTRMQAGDISDNYSFSYREDPDGMFDQFSDGGEAHSQDEDIDSSVYLSSRPTLVTMSEEVDGDSDRGSQQGCMTGKRKHSEVCGKSRLAYCTTCVCMRVYVCMCVCAGMFRWGLTARLYGGKTFRSMR
jgi:hypothetical protein